MSDPARSKINKEQRDHQENCRVNEQKISAMEKEIAVLKQLLNQQEHDIMALKKAIQGNTLLQINQDEQKDRVKFKMLDITHETTEKESHCNEGGNGNGDEKNDSEEDGGENGDDNSIEDRDDNGDKSSESEDAYNDENGHDVGNDDDEISDNRNSATHETTKKENYRNEGGDGDEKNDNEDDAGDSSVEDRDDNDENRNESDDVHNEENGYVVGNDDENIGNNVTNETEESSTPEIPGRVKAEENTLKGVDTFPSPATKNSSLQQKRKTYKI